MPTYGDSRFVWPRISTAWAGHSTSAAPRLTLKRSAEGPLGSLKDQKVPATKEHVLSHVESTRLSREGNGRSPTAGLERSVPRFLSLSLDLPREVKGAPGHRAGRGPGEEEQRSLCQRPKGWHVVLTLPSRQELRKPMQEQHTWRKRSLSPTRRHCFVPSLQGSGVHFKSWGVAPDTLSVPRSTRLGAGRTQCSGSMGTRAM